MVGKRLPTAERFFSKFTVGTADECWEWQASENGAGYGMLWSKEDGRKILAHRYSLSLLGGVTVRPTDLVLHSCDNRRCVNPAHLRVGSHKQNVSDMDQRGRRASNPLKGSKNPNAILSDEQVISLRKDYVSGMSHKSLAARYGVSVLSVSDYTGARSWRHLLGVDGSPTEAELISAKNRKPGAKIDLAAARDIKKRLAAGETGRSIAVVYGVHFGTVSDIKTGKTWADA